MSDDCYPTPCSLVECGTCLHWEWDDGEHGYESGYCPIFRKVTQTDDGEKCTAWHDKPRKKRVNTSEETVGLLERIRMEYTRLDDELRKGKGDWNEHMSSNRKARYIRDETWASWWYARSLLESMLRTFDPDFLSEERRNWDEQKGPTK